MLGDMHQGPYMVCPVAMQEEPDLGAGEAQDTLSTRPSARLLSAVNKEQAGRTRESCGFAAQSWPDAMAWQ